MFFLQGVAVAEDAPRFRSKYASVECVVADVAEVYLFLLVPETGRIVLKPFKAIGIELKHLLVGLLALSPLAHFKVAPCDLGTDPASLLLLGR